MGFSLFHVVLARLTYYASKLNGFSIKRPVHPHFKLYSHILVYFAQVLCTVAQKTVCIYCALGLSLWDSHFSTSF